VIVIKFIEGRKYRVTYKIKGVHRREHVLVAQFLSENDYYFVFNARPIAGTQSLDKKNVIGAQEVPVNTPCSVDP
jgi:hypothetical protein